MKNSPVPSQPVRAILKTASWLALVASSVNALATLRRTPIGTFGGDMAAADSPSLFWNAILTHIDIHKLTDNNGKDVGVPRCNAPLAVARAHRLMAGVSAPTEWFLYLVQVVGQGAGFNVQDSDNLGGRNAIATCALQLRVVKAW